MREEEVEAEAKARVVWWASVVQRRVCGVGGRSGRCERLPRWCSGVIHGWQ